MRAASKYPSGQIGPCHKEVARFSLCLYIFLKIKTFVILFLEMNYKIYLRLYHHATYEFSYLNVTLDFVDESLGLDRDEKETFTYLY